MKKRLFLLGVYFLITPAFILSLIFYQFYLQYQNSSESTKVLGVSTKEAQYTAVPNVSDTSSYVVTTHEVRVDVLREYFAKYKSPLEDYAENIVIAADKYGLDYRLLPAIAMKESTLCLKAPKGLNNCWGFGIYGTKRTGFESYARAIEVISKAMAENYHGIGLIEPEDIMTKYTPSSDGSWAVTVRYVMNAIEESI